MIRGYLVTEQIEGASIHHPRYPLLPGDLLVREADGRYTKEAPGLCVLGFELTPEQEATLEECEFNAHGLEYVVERRKQ